METIFENKTITRNKEQFIRIQKLILRHNGYYARLIVVSAVMLTASLLALNVSKTLTFCGIAGTLLGNAAARLSLIRILNRSYQTQKAFTIGVARNYLFYENGFSYASERMNISVDYKDIASAWETDDSYFIFSGGINFYIDKNGFAKSSGQSFSVFLKEKLPAGVVIKKIKYKTQIFNDQE